MKKKYSSTNKYRNYGLIQTLHVLDIQHRQKTTSAHEDGVKVKVALNLEEIVFVLVLEDTVISEM